MVGIVYVYVGTVFRFYGYFFFKCLVGCLSMIVWTTAVLGVLYACVSYFCICTCSAQLSMFHMERRSRNTLIIIVIIGVIIVVVGVVVVVIIIIIIMPCVARNKVVISAGART